jgi:hypothetical protein
LPEDVGRAAGRRPARPGLPAVRQGQGGQVGHPQQSLHPVHLAGAEIEVVRQAVEDLVGHRRVDLEADSRGVALQPQLALDRRQHVSPVGRGPHAALPGDAEDAAGLHALVREEPRQVGRHHLLQGHDPHARATGPRARPHEPGRDRRKLYHAEAAPALAVGHDDRHVEGEVGRRRQGPARLHHERREHRADPVTEDRRRRRPVVVAQRSPVAQLQADVAQTGAQPLEGRILPPQESLDPLTDLVAAPCGELEEVVDEQPDFGQDPDPLGR